MTKNTQLYNQIRKKVLKLHQKLGWQDILYPTLRTKITYSSNFIEGNTLTLMETSFVINDNISVGGKNLREIFEAKNHGDTWDMMTAELLEPGTDKKQINIDIISGFHNLLVKNIDDRKGGKLRDKPIVIAGINNKFPSPVSLYGIIFDILVWFEASDFTDPLIILETVIIFHLRFIKIIPFATGSGVTARLVSNCILMQNGLPPIDIVPENRLEYLMSLEKSTSQNPQPFLDFLLKQYNDNLDQYLETFEGTN